MKKLARHLAREWEKTAFWSCLALLVAVLVSYLGGLLGDDEDGVLSAKASKQHTPLLNERTAFAFLDPPAEPVLQGGNPFAFVVKAPEQPPPWRPQARQQQVQTPPAPTPSGTPPQTATAPAAPPKVAPVVTPPPAPEPPPKPKRFVTLTYRGLYRGGDEEAPKQLAFVTGTDSETKKTQTLIVAAGQTVSGLTIEGFTPESLSVTGIDGKARTLQVGSRQRFMLE